MGEWVKVLYGLVASLLFGFAVGWLVCKAVTLICAGMDRRRTNEFFTYAQIVGAAAMSFMHGAQDGQKFIGVPRHGVLQWPTQRDRCDDSIWLMILCSTIMGVGTSVGGETHHQIRGPGHGETRAILKASRPICQCAAPCSS